MALSVTDRYPFPWPDGAPPLAVRSSRRARRVRLKVLPPGRVEVVVPHGFARRQLPEILQRHRSWLEQNVARLRRDYQQASLPPTMIDLRAIDQRWVLDCQWDGESAARLRECADNRLLLQGADWRPPLQRWLARMARRQLVPWLEQVSEELALPFARSAVRGQRTRWGSCSARGTISLNYRLLFLPPELVRYLFIHELCHTVQLNHSPRYWALVAEKEPDYRALDKALRRAEALVPPWARAG